MISVFLFCGLLIFISSSCGENKNQKSGTDSAQANAKISASVDGSSLYEANCITCHGDDGRAGTMGAADLSSSTINHAAIVAMVKYGKKSMVAFFPKMNDAQIEAVAKYVETLRK